MKPTGRLFQKWKISHFWEAPAGVAEGHRGNGVNLLLSHNWSYGFLFCMALLLLKVLFQSVCV
jgi:hypothetical protein